MWLTVPGNKRVWGRTLWHGQSLRPFYSISLGDFLSKGNLPIKNAFRAAEMAQRLRALTALPEVLSSILRSHMVADNYLKWDLMPSCVSEVLTSSVAACTCNPSAG